MNLRKLQLKDAPRMLEWMHDNSVVQYMGTNFTSKTIEDCETFINSCEADKLNLHMAIVNDEDLYMGTVSLKHIDKINRCAEFAITVGKEAMGKGFSKFGMNEIVKIGFENLELNQIYWYVSKVNERAVRFYDKNNYKRIIDIPEEFCSDLTTSQIDSYYWYVIDKSE